MLRVKTILFPTDFSEVSLVALPYVRTLARQYGAEVVLAHACESQADAVLQPLRRRLDLMAEYLAPVPSRGVVGSGTPVDFVVGLVDTCTAPWIVMGTHGRRGANRRLHGSTGERMASRAPCPVLTVKEGDRRFVQACEDPVGSEVQIPRLLLPTDFSAPSLAALEAAGDLARRWKSEVVLVNIMNPKQARDPFLRRAAADVLFQLVRRIQPAEARVMLEEGEPSRVIPELARLLDVGMILQGTRGRRTMAGIRLHSRARAVVRRAPCPVLTLHGRPAREEPIRRAAGTLASARR